MKSQASIGQKGTLIEWKAVKGYEGVYEVSSHGLIRRIDREQRRLMKNSLNVDGYCEVKLTKDGISKSFRVHRLVAEAFIENPDNLPEINHINECRTNNRVSNLEWCTHKYNVNYGSCRARQIAAIKKAVVQCSPDGTPIKEYAGIVDAARALGKPRGDANIDLALKGRTKTAYGFVWKYAEGVHRLDKNLNRS